MVIMAIYKLMARMHDERDAFLHCFSCTRQFNMFERIYGPKDHVNPFSGTLSGQLLKTSVTAKEEAAERTLKRHLPSNQSMTRRVLTRPAFVKIFCLLCTIICPPFMS